MILYESSTVLENIISIVADGLSLIGSVFILICSIFLYFSIKRNKREFNSHQHLIVIYSLNVFVHSLLEICVSTVTFRNNQYFCIIGGISKQNKSKKQSCTLFQTFRKVNNKFETKCLEFGVS
jgi:hypothetical protein